MPKILLSLRVLIVGDNRTAFSPKNIQKDNKVYLDKYF